jgi:hypothetical protein
VADRISDLRRQRELLREHLAWIEREIAAAEATYPSDRPGAPVPPQAAPYEIPAEDAEAILAKYRKAPPSIGADTKRGCLAWFTAAMIFLALLAVAAYLAYSRLMR